MGAEFTWVYARTFGSMRSLSESAKEARDADLPSRSEEAPAPPPPPVVALAPRPIVARPRRKTEPVWRTLGIGLAAGVALRFIVPRLLRRR
jgi:hypothetical protein